MESGQANQPVGVPFDQLFADVPLLYAVLARKLADKEMYFVPRILQQSKEFDLHCVEASHTSPSQFYLSSNPSGPFGNSDSNSAPGLRKRTRT
jgi:hypothetical protein